MSKQSSSWLAVLATVEVGAGSTKYEIHSTQQRNTMRRKPAGVRSDSLDLGEE